MEKNYKEYLEHITTFVFDVDGVLTNGDILITSEGDYLRSMSTKDGLAIKMAIKAGYNVCAISAGTNEGVRKRLTDLNIKDIFLSTYNKTRALKKYTNTKDIKLENVLYVGDDLPDHPAMKLVGLPCCPQDAVPEVKSISKYISHKKGGKGCVRDVIEQVLKVQGKWVIDVDGSYD